MPARASYSIVGTNAASTAIFALRSFPPVLANLSPTAQFAAAAHLSVIANAGAAALFASVPLLAVKAKYAAATGFALVSHPPMLANAAASAILAVVSNLSVFAQGFPAAFFAPVFLLHVNTIKLSTAVFALVPNFTMLANARTTTRDAYALLFPMLAECLAATLVTMPLVPSMNAYPRPTAIFTRVSSSAVLAHRTLLPDNISVLMFLDCTIRAAAAPSAGGVCLPALHLAAACCSRATFGRGRSGLDRRCIRHKAAESCCAICAARSCAGTTALHVLLALETRQLAHLHVQCGFSEGTRAPATKITFLRRSSSLLQVRNDALGAE